MQKFLQWYQYWIQTTKPPNPQGKGRQKRKKEKKEKGK